MRKYAENPRTLFHAVADLCDADGFPGAGTLLRTCDASLDLVDYDNWNGGTSRWAVRLRVDPFDFVRLRPRREQLIHHLPPTSRRSATSSRTTRSTSRSFRRSDRRARHGQSTLRTRQEEESSIFS